MAIVEMNKISLIGLNKDKEQILENLMKMGVVEIIDADEKISSEDWSKLVDRDGDSESISGIEEDLEKLKFAIDYLDRFKTTKKGLFEFKRTLAQNELQDVLKDRDRLWSVVNSIIQLDEKLSSMKASKNRKANLIASIEPWESLNIPLELSSTKTSTVSIGVVPALADTESLKNEMHEQIPESYMSVVNKDKEQNYLLIIYYNSAEEAVTNLLKKYGFSKVAFKELTGTARDIIKETEKEILAIDKEYIEIEAKIAAFADEKTGLEVLSDYLTIERDRKKALDNVLKTDKTFMLEGWLPQQASQVVEKVITDKWDCVLSIVKPSEGEEFPVLLANKKIGQSVESITKMYSMPSHDEIDPNSVMGPFYILFFGLMLSDGGYGAIMSILSGLLLWKVKLEDTMKRFMTLMFFCGLSTIFWGAMFGGWFGIEALSEYALWFNPVADPEELLKWSLAFGVIHIYVGIGMRGLNLIRQKKYLDAVLDAGIWYIFFTGFVLFVLPYIPKINADEVGGLVALGKNMLIVGAVLLILTQGRGEKNIVMKLLIGATKLYDLVAFMSDVLSYSRLLALGLATSVIASIINEMGMMGGLDSFLKILIFIVVMIFGHTFNFAINALGAYVHSSRLQYIEFFGKFYKGGGTPFEPLKINTKYVNLKN